MKFRNKLMTRQLLPFALLTLGLATAGEAFARTGTGDIGGGASVCVTQENKVQENCDELLDVHMKRAHRDVTKLPIYAKRVGPVLKALDGLLPEFGQEFREGLTRKRWYFLSGSLPDLGPGNESPLPLKQRAVQYQNDSEIWIDQDWYDQQDEDGQAGIIFHELAMHLRLETRQVIAAMTGDNKYETSGTTAFLRFHRGQNGISVNNVRVLTETLLDDLPSAEDLQALVKAQAFGSFLTAAQKTDFDAFTRDTFGKLYQACQLPDNSDAAQSPRAHALYQAMKPIQDAVAIYDTRLHQDVPLAKQIYITYQYENLGYRIQDGRDANDGMYAPHDNGLPMPMPGETRDYVTHGQVCDHTVFDTGGGVGFNCMDGIQRSCDYAKQVVESRYPDLAKVK